MMRIHLCQVIHVVLRYILVNQIQSHELDLCVLTPLQSCYFYFSGNYSYMGNDTANQNKPWWSNPITYITIEWAYKNDGLNQYGMYRYSGTQLSKNCSLADTLPFNCDGMWSYNFTDKLCGCYQSHNSGSQS